MFKHSSEKELPEAPPQTTESPPAAESATDFPTIPGLDTARAAQILGHDRTFFLELASMFVDQFSEAAEQTRADLARGDRPAAKARLHSLKGNVGNLGGTDLMAATQALETAIAGDAQEQALQPLLTEFTQQLDALIAAIRPCLTQSNAPETVLADSVPLEPERLQALLEALARSELVALDRFAELRPALSYLTDPHTLQSIITDVKALRFPSALAQLQQVLAAHPLDAGDMTHGR